MRGCARGLSRRCSLGLVAAVVLLPGLASAALPPLIDRDLFFGKPDVSAIGLSPDGQRLAFRKALDGNPALWVKRLDEPFAKARPVTEGRNRLADDYSWSRDGRYILFSQDNNGDENFDVYAVDPEEQAAAGHRAPPARTLTHAKGVRSIVYGTPSATPDTIYVGMNDRDKAWHDLYSVQISTGKRTLARKNDLRAIYWRFDAAGRLRLAIRSAENGDTEILRLDGRQAAKIYSCTVYETCIALEFHPDGKRFYMLSNRGAGVDLLRLMLVDVADGHEELVEQDPSGHVDLDGVVFSERTHALLAARYPDDAGTRWSWHDLAAKADFEWLQSKLGHREIDLSMTPDDRLWIVNASADVEPGETWLFDRRKKTLTLQYRALEAVPRSSLALTTPIRYPSSDGLSIPAYLTLPPGVEAKSLPLLVIPHGGPWARIQWGYISFAQFFANRGFAVLQPNFRGSTGYGKRFYNAGNREWGEKMQDDVTFGVRYLVNQGIVDPRRIGIFGDSFGGYVTLVGVTKTPPVYSAAASWVGPSDLMKVIDSLTGIAEPARRMFYERIGDPTTDEGRAQLERQSPIYFIDRVRTPLLIIQGANDPRVPRADTDRLVAALRKRGMPVEYLVASDEGHVMGVGLGFARPINNQAIFAALEKFFAQRLGTRFQESMTPEVAQRLKELSLQGGS